MPRYTTSGPGFEWDSAAREFDEQVRNAAFVFLTEQAQVLGEVLPREVLAAGFTFQGQRVPCLGPQGIFKPKGLQVPLSITTVPPVPGRDLPYADRLSADSLLTYKYRGDNISHHDNAGLRRAMALRVPLVYFRGVVPGRYLAAWPVYVVRDDPSTLSFTVEVDCPESLLGREADGLALVTEGRRRYITQLTQRRLHQELFRWRVLKAYRECCAICRIRHAELLDAAHILPDGHPKGEPVVPNGLALCKLHHAAFDSNILGIRPDLVIELRPDILVEADGPMLRFGLQGFQGKLIQAPRAADLRPSSDFLTERFELFRKAS